MSLTRDPIQPSPHDSLLATRSRAALASEMRESDPCDAVAVKVHGMAEPVSVPASAFRLFMEILDEMSQGNALVLIPYHRELTTQEAADLLQVSRPHVIKLLDGNAIPHRKVGNHRRVRFDDVMRYKHTIDTDRLAVLDELAALGQELDIGPEEPCEPGSGASR